MTFSEGVSRKMSNETLSFASIASFRMIPHRSYVNGGSSVCRSQNASIPRRSRSLGADSAL